MHYVQHIFTDCTVNTDLYADYFPKYIVCKKQYVKILTVR